MKYFKHQMKQSIFAGFCGFDASFWKKGHRNLKNLQRSEFAVRRDGEESLFVYKTLMVRPKMVRMMMMGQMGECMRSWVRIGYKFLYCNNGKTKYCNNR